MTELYEYWRGSVEAGDCDAMGHMSVGNWLRRYWSGTAVLAAQIGLPLAFAPNTRSTLAIKSIHMHWLKEAHAGAPLFLRGGVCAFGDTELGFYGEFVKTETDEIAATFTANIEHINADSFIRTNWPRNIKAPQTKVTIPKYGLPRSINMQTQIEQREKSWVTERGFIRVGLGNVTLHDVDCFGRLNVNQFISRVGEAIPNIMAKWRTETANEAQEIGGTIGKIGGAALENRTEIFSWPRIGDIIEVHSGLSELGDKTYNFEHWLLCGHTGKAFSMSKVTVIAFDLETRKAISIPPNARDQLQKMLIR